MAAYEEKTGGDVLAIAHNGNLSNGRMFPLIESFTGKPIDREYAETRARWERIYEATQIKGDGETHPLLSPNDEFASFERWDKGNLDLSELKQPDMLQYEYARSALKLGLKVEAAARHEPYKFGLIGSTDAHTGLAAVEEDNFFGKTSSSEPSPDRAMHPFVKTEKATIMGWEQTASGYAAVWATENTREALFDAMQRKEVYATTGPRMTVRFFGGFDFEAGDARNRMPARDRLPQGRADGRRPRARRRPARRRPSSSPRSRIRSARTSTASRSSRAGSTRPARSRRRSTTWSGPASASPIPGRARSRRSGTRWTWPTRPTPTRSASRS